MPSHRSPGPTLFALALTLAAGSRAGGLPPPPRIQFRSHHPKGVVHISHPQVSTRESEVIPRDNDVRWLEARMEEATSITGVPLDDSTELHARSDSDTISQSFTSVAARAGRPAPAGGSPDPGPVHDSGYGSPYPGGHDHRPAPHPQGKSPAGPPQARPLGLSRGMMAREHMEATVEAVGGQPAPRGPAVTGAKLSRLDRVKDLVAVRDVVRSMIREKKLDDTHDLSGLTLYSLQFLATVSPGYLDDNTYRVGIRVVDGGFDTAPGVVEWERKVFFDRWRRSLQAWFDDEMARLRFRWEARVLSDRDRTDLHQAALPALDLLETALGDAGGDGRLLDRCRGLLFDLGRGIGEQAAAGSPPAAEVLDLVVPLVRIAEFRAELATARVPETEKLVSVEARVARSPVTGALAVLPRISIADDPALRIRWLRGLFSFPKPLHVYSVSPKELAQNVSDVASADQTSGMQLGLEAPGLGGGAAASHESVERVRRIADAVKRRPLVVGYMENQREFGWYLGPGVVVQRNGSLSLRQRTAEYAVSASFAVPAWWQFLCLDGEVETIDHKGRRRERHGLFVEDGKGQAREAGICGSCPEGSIHVSLPGDVHALTQQVLFGGARPGPTISRIKTLAGKPRVRVSLDRDAGFILHGDDLWRNPRCFVAGIELKTEILPDMKGLVLHLPDPAVRANLLPGTYDLTLVTTYGTDILRDGIELHRDGGSRPSEPGPGSPPPAARAAAPRGVPAPVPASVPVPDPDELPPWLRP